MLILLTAWENNFFFFLGSFHAMKGFQWFLNNPADRPMLGCRQEQLKWRKRDVIYSTKHSFVTIKNFFHFLFPSFPVLWSLLQRQRTFRHSSSIIKHDTFGVTGTLRQGEGRNAVAHMTPGPLYAAAKPIIHVKICLGKLGSTLENKQPESCTGVSGQRWCLADWWKHCHADILQRQAFFFVLLQDITP